MGTIDGMLLEIDSFTQNANIAKNLTLNRLFEDDIINSNEFDEYVNNWHVIVIKKGWFKKLLSKDNDNWEYRLVKMSL